MAKEKMKHALTSFTADGDFLAVLSPDGVVKVWSTGTGSLLAEWKQSDGDSNATISCIACSFIGKKRTKGKGTCLVATGTDDGNVLVVNVLTGEVKWKSTVCQSGGISSISFANKGRKLYVVGSNGMASEIKSETGEVVKEHNISKKSICTSTCSSDEMIVAGTKAGIRMYSIEDEKEIMKFTSDHVLHIATSNDANIVVESKVGEKELQVWRCEFSTNTPIAEHLIYMKSPPVSIECKSGITEEDSYAVLAVSESGIAYIWTLKNSNEEIDPSTITVKAKNPENSDTHASGKSKKGRISIIAARLNDLKVDEQVKVLIAYGSLDSPQFSIIDSIKPGEDLVITETLTSVQENEIHEGKGLEEDGATPVQTKKKSKKRAASDPDSAAEGTLIDNGETDVKDDNDLSEPTMGEKLASLNIVENENVELKPPSADSVHVLLKQALHADDQPLLLDCLFRKDDKVVTNTISVLNPSDVLKLLQRLISLIHSRGAVLVCVLPWLRSLLLHHASVIMSQESSLLALNSLFQLIESRNSTFNPSIQLSTCLDLLYAGSMGDESEDENEGIEAVIFEDNDESDEDASQVDDDDTMETDDDDEEHNDNQNIKKLIDDGNFSDFDGSGMSED
jgi:U3 small nucleolar RNA-associated protein 5